VLVDDVAGDDRDLHGNSLPDAMGSITTRSYSGHRERVIKDELDRVSDLLAGNCDVVWIDIDEPSPEDLRRLAEELELHPLSVEDALDPHQRDKYVHYDRHVFLVAHAVDLDVDAAVLSTIELDVFIAERWLVTVRHGSDELIEEIIARWQRARRLIGTQVGVAVYAILDVTVDGYFDAIDRFESYYDDAADRVFGESPIEPKAHRHWFEMRRALNQFDRIVGPLSEALLTVVTEDLPRFDPESEPYLRDVAGELNRASAEVDSLRELVSHLVDANLVLRDYRQNLVMKKVTSWAAIIAVPTLVTGWYGMNVPYPGEGETWGVIASTAIAVSCSGALYALFKRKGWL
jgi:magnesium transporter